MLPPSHPKGCWVWRALATLGAGSVAFPRACEPPSDRPFDTPFLSQLEYSVDLNMIKDPRV